ARAAATASVETPRAWHAARAASEFSTLKRPGSGVRTATSPSGPWHRKREPAASKLTSRARESALSLPPGEHVISGGDPASANSAATRAPYGSSTFTTAAPGEDKKSCRLAAK